MFTIGKAPPKPKQSRTHPHRRASSKPTLSGESRFGERKSWLLIPREQLSAYQYSILTTVKSTFLTLWLAAYDLKRVYPEDSKDYVFLRAFHPSSLTFQDIQGEVQKAFHLNQTLRFAFKRLANLWRARRLEFVNAVDVVTQEPLQKPVYVYDWNLRKVYQFEASTVLRDSTLRLLNHNCLMMECLPPRNILTNTNFTEAQCISLFKQMQTYGVTNSHWECFARSGFNVQKLLFTYEVPMRLEILQKLFRAYSWEAADLLLDFIDAQYNKANTLIPDENLLILVLKRHWTNPYVSSWIELCKRDWAAQIRPHTYTDVFQAVIQHQAAALIHKTGKWTELSKQKK